MRKLNAIEIIAFTYCLYFSITLAIEQDMFDQQSELYSYFSRIHESEMVWGITAFVISLIYFFSFIIKHQTWISITASVASGLFFIVVGSAYMITYPNIGSGIFTIVGIVCFLNIGHIAIPYDEELKEMKETNETENTNQAGSEK